MDFSPVIDYIESVLRAEKGVPGCDLRIMQNHRQLLRYTSGVSDYEGKHPFLRMLCILCTPAPNRSLVPQPCSW